MLFTFHCSSKIYRQFLFLFVVKHDKADIIWIHELVKTSEGFIREFPNTKISARTRVFSIPDIREPDFSNFGNPRTSPNPAISILDPLLVFNLLYKTRKYLIPEISIPARTRLFSYPRYANPSFQISGIPVHPNPTFSVPNPSLVRSKRKRISKHLSKSS